MAQRRSALGLGPLWSHWSDARVEGEEEALVDAMSVEELRRAHDAEFALALPLIEFDPVARGLLLRRQVSEIPPEFWTPEESALVALWTQGDLAEEEAALASLPVQREESA